MGIVPYNVTENSMQGAMPAKTQTKNILRRLRRANVNNKKHLTPSVPCKRQRQKTSDTVRAVQTPTTKNKLKNILKNEKIYSIIKIGRTTGAVAVPCTCNPL